MLYEILKHIRNFFPDGEKQMVGAFKVEGGAISPFPILPSGQYFLIEGSVFNDGIWKAGELTDLTDEEFEGVVTPLKIPKDFLNLVAEIETFQENVQPSTMQSESFGGYSYTRSKNSSGQLAGWQDAFATRLNAWRKM